VETAIYGILIGFLGGFAGGMLGIGGGAIYVPAMVLLLDRGQHVAQGASLAAIVATGLVGGATHLRQQNVDLQAVAFVAPVAVLTGFGAALLADVLDAEVLRRIFAVVAGYVALMTIYGSLREMRAARREAGQ
jgi:uncharacterized membrane protein YfcA